MCTQTVESSQSLAKSASQEVMDSCARIRVVPPEEFKNKSSLKSTEIHHIIETVITDTGLTNG